MVSFTGDDVYDAVRDAAADLGLPLRSLRKKARSLEDVYIGNLNAQSDAQAEGGQLMNTTDITSRQPRPMTAEPARRGEVFDRGYKHYDGERLGRKHAFTALIRYSMKRALGIKKGWGSKIIPIIVYVAVMIPVIVSIGIKGFVPSANIISYNAPVRLDLRDRRHLCRHDRARNALRRPAGKRARALFFARDHPARLFLGEATAPPRS